MIELVMAKRGCSYDELFEAYYDVCKENEVLQKDFDKLDNDNLELIDKIEKQKKQISELEAQIERDKELLEVKTAEVSISEGKILSCLCPYCGKIVAGKIPNGYEVDEEPLPFSSDEYEECLEEELEDLRERHQQDCITIKQLHTTIDTLVDRYAKLREIRGL